MEPKDYLESLFTKYEPYSLSDKEKAIVAKDKKAFILQKLLRKKYRKQKLHPNTILDITRKVEISVDEQKPIHLVIPFGGYKHFWNSSHPQSDWAELFTLKFLTQWVSPVIAIHNPGVLVEFISEDVILSRMNNYPENSLDQYAKSFSLLLDIYKKYTPENLRIKFFRISDKYDKNKIVNQVEKLLPSSWKKWNTYSDNKKGLELKRSKRSVMWKGKEDLTGLTEKEKEKRVIESRLVELAYYTVEAKPEFLGNYFLEDNHIPICFSYGLSPDNSDHWITLGSTYASTVDFWIGRGILEEKDSNFVNRIVSRRQYEKIKEYLKVFEIDFGLITSKNYKSIEVIQEKDWEKAILLS